MEPNIDDRVRLFDLICLCRVMVEPKKICCRAAMVCEYGRRWNVKASQPTCLVADGLCCPTVPLALRQKVARSRSVTIVVTVDRVVSVDKGIVKQVIAKQKHIGGNVLEFQSSSEDRIVAEG